jgi:hypothetical protein
MIGDAHIKGELVRIGTEIASIRKVLLAMVLLQRGEEQDKAHAQSLLSTALGLGR